MKTLVDAFKALALVAAAIAAWIAGPILAALVVVAIAIWIAYRIMQDHREDMDNESN